jgi:hypothetical protein
MGLEDAATIATLFPSGTKPSEVSSRIKTYENIRKPRAEHVSQLSTDGLQIDVPTLFGCSSFPYLYQSQLLLIILLCLAAWIVPDLLGHDPVEVAKKAMDKL